MTKKIWNYAINVITTVGWFSIMNAACGVIEESFHADVSGFRSLLLLFGIIAAVCLLWRGINGLYCKGDFWIDENQRRW